MKKTVLVSAVVAIVASSALTGCAPRVVGYSPLASQTLRVGADQDSDIVWLLRIQGDGSQTTETVLRCYNSQQGPVCVPARAAQ
jgi:hypothetical protein